MKKNACMKNEDVWFEAGSQDPEHWPVISAESPGRESREERTKKQQDLRESWIMPRKTHSWLSLFVASFVLSGSNKTQNSSQAANKLAALS